MSAQVTSGFCEHSVSLHSYCPICANDESELRTVAANLAGMATANHSHLFTALAELCSVIDTLDSSQHRLAVALLKTYVDQGGF